VVSPDDPDRVLAILTARHLDCWVLGTLKKAGKSSSRVELVGRHARF
jgi:phosphoribosylformylglycinamidine cyclo-ligase